MQNAGRLTEAHNGPRERTAVMTRSLYFVEYSFFYFTGFFADKVLLCFANNRKPGSRPV